jgi:hypothetical protein
VYPVAPSSSAEREALRLDAAFAEAAARADWIALFGGTGEPGGPPPLSPLPRAPVEHITVLPDFPCEPGWAGLLQAQLGVEPGASASDFSVLLMRGNREVSGVLQVRRLVVAHEGMSHVLYESRLVRDGVSEAHARFALPVDLDAGRPVVGAWRHGPAEHGTPATAFLQLPDPGVVPLVAGAVPRFAHHVVLWR